MNKKITAFVARSFAASDDLKVKTITDHLDSFRHLGFVWQTAEGAEIESVSAKVQRLIEESNVFIAIVTRRHQVAAREPVGTTTKYRRKKFWTAPPWILQEMGYALKFLGLKRLIIFVEDGVEIPHLQGDLEYIGYNAKDPASALKRANEMINQVIGEASGISTEVIVSNKEGTETVEDVSPAQDRQVEGESHQEQATSSRRSLLVSAVTNNEWEKAEQIYQEIIADPAASSTELSEVRAFFQFSRVVDSKEGTNAFQVLLDLRQNEPSDYYSRYYIGLLKWRYRSYEEAATFFVEASRVATKPSGQYGSLILAARAYQKAGKDSVGRELLLAAITANDIPFEQRHDILVTLATAFENFGDPRESAAFGELALSQNPADSSLRFKLGLHYHKLEQYDLFLLHYHLLLGSQAHDAATVHNLALANKLNELPNLAVRRYKESIELGGTLAANNLARIFLDAGLSDDAAKLLRQALEKVDCDSTVGGTLVEANKLVDDEVKAEEERLKEATPIREFLVEFGAGLISMGKADVSGGWEFPFGRVDLHFVGDQILGSSSWEKEVPGTSLLGGVAGRMRKTTISFTGVLKGLSCTYTGEKVIEHRPSSAPASKPTLLGGFNLGALAGDTKTTLEGLIRFYSDTAAVIAESSKGTLTKVSTITRTASSKKGSRQ